MATANWTRMVSSVPKEKAHAQTRKKGELTRKKGPESEFDEDKKEDKPENDDYDEEEYAEEGGKAAERGGEAVARKSEGDRPLPFWDAEPRSLTADAREIPRALGDTFLVKAEARASRNVQEKPAGNSIAPVDERSERRSPSGTNSHRFKSLPSSISFQTLLHFPIGIG